MFGRDFEDPVTICRPSSFSPFLVLPLLCMETAHQRHVYNPKDILSPKSVSNQQPQHDQAVFMCEMNALRTLGFVSPFPPLAGPAAATAVAPSEATPNFAWEDASIALR